MLIQYRHVDFNELFIHEGKTYIKCNHNRGKYVGEKGKIEYRYFKKNDVVKNHHHVTPLNKYLEIGT